MTTTPVSAVRYSVNRLTVAVGAAPAEFRSRYEQAVPPFPADQVADLVRRQAPETRAAEDEHGHELSPFAGSRIVWLSV